MFLQSGVGFSGIYFHNLQLRDFVSFENVEIPHKAVDAVQLIYSVTVNIALHRNKFAGTQEGKKGQLQQVARYGEGEH